jgi:hypothetical protein
VNRRLAIVLALAACLAVGSVSFVVGKPGVNRVKTRLSLIYANTGTPPTDQSVFSGKVKAKNGCKRGRKVTVENFGTGTVVGATGTVIGATKSANNGNYSISLPTAAPAGTYLATAKKKTRKRGNGTKIICRKGVSNAVTAP